MTPQELQLLLEDKIRSGGQGGLTLASEAREFLSAFIDSVYTQIAQDVLINENALDGKVPKSGDFTIEDIKTFTTLPKSEEVPEEDDDLVNKKYVDDKIVEQASTESFEFDSDRPIKRQVIGLENINLGKATARDTLEALLYPIKMPTGTVEGPATHLYGDDTAVSVRYTLVKTDQPITGANINGVNIPISSGEDQEGTINVPQNPASDTVFTLTVVAGEATFSTSFVSSIVHACYAGDMAKDNVISPVTNADINALTIFELAQPVSVTVGENKYLALAVPEDGNLPFFINGIFSNYFTTKNIAFTNPFGNTSNYVLYVSKSFATGTNLLSFLSPKII